MDQTCDRCGQSFPGDTGRCPRCTALNGSAAERGQRTPEAVVVRPEVGAASLPDGSDAQIDLGRPVTELQAPTGPPSGASFVSWTSLLAKRKKTGDATPAPARMP